jgi:hypothetical protein
VGSKVFRLIMMVFGGGVKDDDNIFFLLLFSWDYLPIKSISPKAEVNNS